jgi:uncharacterized protein YukE
MGLEGAIDSIGDGLDHAALAVSHGLGKAADGAAHLVGGGLDALGLHSAAQAVDGFGDSVADTLGAQVGESQLGQTEDPTKLVHGDVRAITESATHLAKFAAGFAMTAEGLAKIDTAHWSGKAADAFHAQYSQHPRQWSDAADACTEAGKTLQDYADTVRWAQRQAAEAVRLYKQAKQDSDTARDAYNKQVDVYNAQVLILTTGTTPGQVPQKPGDFHDPGLAGATQARDVLGDARAQRNNAGEQAKAALDRATATAPAKPRFTDRMLNGTGDLLQGAGIGLEHLYGGIAKGAGGMLQFVRGLNPLDPYNLTHPAAFVDGLSATAAGLLRSLNHPVDLLKGLVGDGWGSDPFEALGKLIPNIAAGVVTDGATVAESATGRVAVSVGEDAAKQAAFDAGKGAVDRDALGSTGAPHETPPTLPPPTARVPDTIAGTLDDFGPHGPGDFGPPGGHDPGTSQISNRLNPDPPPVHADPAPHTDGGGHHPGDGHEPDGTGAPQHHGGDTPPPADHGPSSDYSDPHHHATDADHQAFNDKFGPGNAQLLQQQIARAPDVGLANEEIRALDHYTGMAHQDLNAALRDGDVSALNTMDPEIREAVSGLNKLPDFQGRVFRGIDVAPGDMQSLIDRYTPGAHVREPAFTSSDMNAPFSGNVEFVIDSTAGKDISWLKDAWNGQKEVLFGPDNGFTVVSRDFDAATDKWKIRLKDAGR